MHKQTHNTDVAARYDKMDRLELTLMLEYTTTIKAYYTAQAFKTQTQDF